jgi:Cys-tRNA(Pro)/Cys-tRNA(Cys) deacylase
MPRLIGYDGRMNSPDASPDKPSQPLDILDRAGAAYRTHAHPPLVTAEDFRAHSPFPPAAMVKTLVFRTPDGGYALAALKAFDKLDYKKLADALGIRRADLRAAEAEEITRDLGFEIGGVCPLTDRADAVILIDPGVEALETVFCGTGLNTLSLEIAGPELVRASGGRLVAIAK